MRTRTGTSKDRMINGDMMDFKPAIHETGVKYGNGTQLTTQPHTVGGDPNYELSCGYLPLRPGIPAGMGSNGDAG